MSSARDQGARDVLLWFLFSAQTQQDGLQPPLLLQHFTAPHLLGLAAELRAPLRGWLGVRGPGLLWTPQLTHPEPGPPGRGWTPVHRLLLHQPGLQPVQVSVCAYGGLTIELNVVCVCVCMRVRAGLDNLIIYLSSHCNLCLNPLLLDYYRLRIKHTLHPLNVSVKRGWVWVTCCIRPASDLQGHTHLASLL